MHKYYKLPSNTEGFFLDFETPTRFRLSVLLKPSRAQLAVQLEEYEREALCTGCPHFRNKGETIQAFAAFTGKKAPDISYIEALRWERETETCTSKVSLGTKNCYVYPQAVRKNVEVALPPLLVIGKGDYSGLLKDWRLFGLGVTEETKHKAVHLGIGNIYTSGRICWGRQNQLSQGDPLEVVQNYFGSVFNKDLQEVAVGEYLDYSCAKRIEMYNHEEFIQTRKSVNVYNVKELIQPPIERVLSVSHRKKCHGILISNAPGFLKKIPDECKYFKDKPLVIAAVTSTPTANVVSIKNYLGYTSPGPITSRTKLNILGKKDEIC